MRMFLFVLAVGCVTTDVDGDGYASLANGGQDCDDHNADVSPGMTEACGDQLDNDCDGAIDDGGLGSVPWFEDADGDGWGSVERGRVCPELPLGLGATLQGGDCNDEVATVHPGVEHDLCNAVDDDCNGSIDDGAGAAAVLGVPYVTLQEAIEAALAEQASEVVVDICEVEAPNLLVPWQVSAGSIVLRGTHPTGTPTLAAASGAEVQVAGTAALVLEGLVVQSEDAPLSFRVSGDASVSLRSTQVRNNAASVLVAEGNATVEVEDSELSGNQEPPLTVSGSATATVLRSELTRNLGAGVHASGNATLLVEASSITHTEGAGVEASGFATVTLRAVTMDRNDEAVRFAASQQAGRAASAILHEVTITASQGGIALNGPIAATMENVDISGTSARRALTIVDNDVPATLTDMAIHDNVAGGIELVRASATATRVAVADNHHAGAGGGVRLEDSTYEGLAGVTITGNEAANGGGIALAGVSDLSGVTVSSNVATWTGGGMWVAPPTDPKVHQRMTVANVTLQGNTATMGGGYNHPLDTSVRLTDSRIVDNRATMGGGLYYEEPNNIGTSCVRCDWGADKTDNVPEDVAFEEGYTVEWLGTFESVACTTFTRCFRIPHD